MKARYLTPHILSDINDKMVFIGGARQVGKTWLARFIGENNFPAHQYLNWDYAPDRQDILQYRFQGDAKILLFDEIHKYKDWKNYLKGLFDKERESYRMLVTGSTRLDVYRRGGDSLMGRYYYYRLHPFSVAEFLESENPLIPGKEIALAGPGATISAVHDLLWRFGGFPEPLMKQNVRFLRRWRTQRQERLVREDIRDLASIRDLSSLQILLDMLPGRLGSLLSLNAVREDLAVDHKTAAHWLEILESFYYAFRIYPFSHNKIKSLRNSPSSTFWTGRKSSTTTASSLKTWSPFTFSNYVTTCPIPRAIGWNSISCGMWTVARSIFSSRRTSSPGSPWK